jgi:hypothetical protein
MYNFNGSKHRKRAIAIIALVLIGAMVVTTLVSALIF